MDAAICVSNICKENLIQRAAVNPNDIHVIGNAVNTTKFTPDPGLRYPLN
jgi:phosphatidylinositol glycan class A protein